LKIELEGCRKAVKILEAQMIEQRERMATDAKEKKIADRIINDLRSEISLLKKSLPDRSPRALDDAVMKGDEFFVNRGIHGMSILSAGPALMDDRITEKEVDLPDEDWVDNDRGTCDTLSAAAKASGNAGSSDADAATVKEGNFTNRGIRGPPPAMKKSSDAGSSLAASRITMKDGEWLTARGIRDTRLSVTGTGASKPDQQVQSVRAGAEVTTNIAARAVRPTLSQATGVKKASPSHKHIIVKRVPVATGDEEVSSRIGKVVAGVKVQVNSGKPFKSKGVLCRSVFVTVISGPIKPNIDRLISESAKWSDNTWSVQKFRSWKDFQKERMTADVAKFVQSIRPGCQIDPKKVQSDVSSLLLGEKFGSGKQTQKN
jgi:hypothetical protein